MLATAQIYMTVDKNGTTHYSDTPSPNATKIEVLPSTNVLQSNTPTTTQVEKLAPVVQAAAKQPYTLFTIVTPKDQETIQNQPTITVQVRLDPTLQKGDRILLFLDNQPQGTPQEALQFTLVHIDRGIHQLRAALTDVNGNILKETPTVTIFVHYASVGGQASNAVPTNPKKAS